MRKIGGRLAAALCALAVCLSCEEKPSIEKMGIVGGAVSLEPEVKAGTNMTEISWKKGMDLVAEWDPDLWVAPRFQGRLDLDSTTGSLTLVKLQQNDSGQYNAEVVEGNEIQCTSFFLRILENAKTTKCVPIVRGEKTKIIQVYTRQRLCICKSGCQVSDPAILFPLKTLMLLIGLDQYCAEPPRPPQLNCTAIGDRIHVRCELEDALYPAEKIPLSYGWKYQKSNKPIPGNSSKIYLEKDVDLSENVMCIIHVLDANTSSSIGLRDCIPTGAASQRNRAWLSLPFLTVTVSIALVAIYWWKGGRFTCRRNGKTQECEDGTNAAGAPPEEQCLREECSGNLEENGSKGPSDPVT